MEIRFAIGKKETRGLDTEGLRENFLVSDLFAAGQVKLVYSHHDRVIIGGAMPAGAEVILPNPAELRASYFLERRELGIINLGGPGTVTADGGNYALDKLECLYLGKGVQDIRFQSDDSSAPAKFYILSAPTIAPTASTPGKR